MRAVRVELDVRSYSALVGEDLLEHLGELMDSWCPDVNPGKVVVVTQAPVEDAGWLAAAMQGIDGLKAQAAVVRIDDGERAKSLETLESLCRQFAKVGLERMDAVIALGGGVVTDVAGFAASVYLRGISLVNVPTTLLSQVDAALGGKTGVDLPEGKNLVGSFWQPRLVVCDTRTLDSLPERELLSGRGELAKYAFLGAGKILELGLADQVASALSVKAGYVSKDEREATGARMALNYGHTVGHAVEAASLERSSGTRLGDKAHGLDAEPLSHGESVAIGMVAAARIAERMGRIDVERVVEHLELLRGLGLPTSLPQWVDAAELMAYISRDKKNRGGLTFVLDGPAGVEPVFGVDPSMVTDVLEEMKEQ
jgi:5-deoxy-5-amino-3-dehydroquinate synthase